MGARMSIVQGMSVNTGQQVQSGAAYHSQGFKDKNLGTEDIGYYDYLWTIHKV